MVEFLVFFIIGWAIASLLFGSNLNKKQIIAKIKRLNLQPVSSKETTVEIHRDDWNELRELQEKLSK